MKTLILITILIMTSTSFAKTKAKPKKKAPQNQEMTVETPATAETNSPPQTEAKADEGQAPNPEDGQTTNTNKRIQSITLGIGNLAQYVGKIQTENGTGTEKFNFNLMFLGDLRLKLNESFLLIPYGGIAFPKKGADEHITKYNFLLGMNLGYKRESLLFKFGLGYAFTAIKPDGENQTLPNGNSQTTFFTPDETRMTYNITTNLGAEYFFTTEFSGNVEFYVYNLTDSNSRALSYLLSLNYHVF